MKSFAEINDWVESLKSNNIPVPCGIVVARNDFTILKSAMRKQIFDSDKQHTEEELLIFTESNYLNYKKHNLMIADQMTVFFSMTIPNELSFFERVKRKWLS